MKKNKISPIYEYTEKTDKEAKPCATCLGNCGQCGGTEGYDLIVSGNILYRREMVWFSSGWNRIWTPLHRVDSGGNKIEEI